MAGETVKSTALANAQAGIKREARLAKGKRMSAIDVDAVATGELEAADVTLMHIDIPSNAIITDVYIYSDDLDSNGTPTLALDIGLFAAEDFTSITSGSKTKHDEDDVLDADALVDGSTTAQAATTSWTKQALDAATLGPDDCTKAAWEILGYDEDPKTIFRVGVTMATAAATAAAGDLGVRVDYLVD